MDVSIIIVNYNSIDLTIDCVNSIFQQTADVEFEIVIVDNASKNKEAERLQEKFENRVKMIDAKTNLGFVKGVAKRVGIIDSVYFARPASRVVYGGSVLFYERRSHCAAACWVGVDRFVS